jgi:predicted amidophosphoribosyltransferase
MRDEVLRDYAISAGMRLMVEDAVSKVLQGLTTMNEVLRVVPHVKQVNPVCLHCRSALNPRFRFCPVCGAAYQTNFVPGENYVKSQPLSGPV